METSKKNRGEEKGFTLVELLAVIVILAIILVIAVPKVMSVIEDSKKATLESTAKMIASAAEKAKVQNTVLGKTEDITCDSVAKINKLDYETCKVDFEDNTAKVTIKGSGKFAGLSVCSGTKMNATAQTGECASNTLVAHIQNLYNDETTRLNNGLMKDNTVDQNIRYSGSNEVVKNYVEFGNENELWRIIGVFEVETENGTEELVKIVREDSIGNIAWDVSDVNNGNEINQWGESGDYPGADLMQLLNGSYLSKQNAENTCLDLETEEMGICNFSSTGMSSSYKSMIETVVWNTGAIDVTDPNVIDLETYTMSTIGWYNAERGTVGKTCPDGEYDSCNDTVARTTTWEGQVALPYVSDYAYATSESACYTNMLDGVGDYYTTTCKNNNWMNYDVEPGSYDYCTWLLSPVAIPEDAGHVSAVFGGGVAEHFNAYFPFRVRPTLYLKSNIQIIDGDGSSGNVYKLK